MRRDAAFALALAVCLVAGLASPAPAADAPLELTAADIHALIRSGRQTCMGVVQYYAQRIANFDKMSRASVATLAPRHRPAQSAAARRDRARLPPCCLEDAVPNAVISLSTQWHTQAAALDQLFNITGELAGPLHCVPVMVKDNVDTYDMPTSCGAVALRYMMGAGDAAAVRRMRNAGAIVLAKNNMAELALSGVNSFSSLGRETVNAYHFNMTASGSSGGTGVAVTANFGVIGLGTDTCGSILGPAGASNLFGLRSSHGLVSTDGVAPAAVSRDVLGPLTRTVADNALALDALLFGADTGKYKYSTALSADAARHVRVGVWQAAMDKSPLGSATDAAVQSAVKEAAAVVEAAGASVISVTDSADEIYAAIEAVRDVDVMCTYLEGYETWAEYLARFGPAAPVQHVEQLLETDGGVLLSTAVALKAMLRAVSNTNMTAAEACAPVYARREALADTIRAYMVRHSVDVLLYPVDAQQVGEAARQDPVLAPFCEVSAFSGLPTISIPIGFLPPPGRTSPQLPLGMLALADTDREDLLYALAYAYEQRAHPRAPPSPIPLVPISVMPSA